MNVLTITNPSCFAKAVVMARSVREFHADWPVTIVVAARSAVSFPSLPEGVRQVTTSEFGMQLDDDLVTALDGTRLLEALRGQLLATAAANGQSAVYIDPSMRVTGSLKALEDALSDSDLVLVPYRTSAGSTQQSVESRSHGVFHPGVMAFRAGPASTAVAQAWPGLDLALGCDPAPAERTALQAWLDALPVNYSGVSPLRSERFLAGYWNLNQGDVRLNGDGLIVNDEPVALLDLLTFDYEYPHLLSTRYDGPDLSSLPAIADLCARHASELKTALQQLSGNHDPFECLPDGTRLSLLMRRLATEATAAGELTASIFTPEGMDDFYAWLNAPAGHGAAAGLTRYHEAIWNDADHIRAAYPMLDGPDAIGYAGWLCVFGPETVSMPAALMPPEPEYVAQHRSVFDTNPLWGVNVAGFFRSELGLGEAARSLMAALDAAKVPSLPVQGTLVPPCRQEAEFAFLSPDRAPFPINVICMNGDSIPVFARDAGQHFFERRYSIALWWWEVGVFPENWHQAFNYLDEIWVGSEHIYETIAAVSPIPVFKVTMPVSVPRITKFSRGELGMPDGKFAFLFIYDYHSTSSRKNPVGLVKAFKAAFPPGSGAALVLKCINAEKLPAKHQEVLVEAGDHPDIHVVDRYVSAAEKDAMVAACDCYVSLHRSEGFGLTPAEAMWLGKPVIATRYGGTLEYMTAENSYLVDYELAPVGNDAHPYPPDAIWADPNLDQAAELMRHVFENQGEAQARGRRAFEDIRHTNAPAVAGAVMERRLQNIFERISKQPEFDLIPSRHSMRWQNLDMTPLPGLLPRLKRLVKRVFARGERLLRRRQRAIDEAVAALERKQAALHAETLGGFRRTRGDLDDLRRQINLIGPEFESHLAEHRAVPRLAAELEFTNWVEPQTGAVFGFREPLPSPDESYRAFTDAFRGTEDHVKDLQKPYVELLAANEPVLDVGCGRGELLDLLAERGIETIGVDNDEGMVAFCQRSGHRNVVLADANQYLTGASDRSLGAIFSAQVVEHIPFQELMRFLELAVAKLKPGGTFIAETVNVHSLQSLKAFWVDPTHEHPLFPETLLQLCRIAGFEQAYVFHPNGVGNVDVDRYREPAYAVVARTARD